MSLSENDRRTLVTLQIEKAHRFLAQADEMCQLKHWDIAANRYYYACFHAVQALFIQNGLSSRRHAGMLRQFGLHFIQTNKMENRFGAFLTRMEQLREKGDYNCFYTVTEEDIATMSAPAHELVGIIEELCS